MQNKHIPPIPVVPADFQRALLNWYDDARRDLPWRARPDEKADPYKVWLSEIMLQQTTVKAVIPYFETFMGDGQRPRRWLPRRAMRCWRLGRGSAITRAPETFTPAHKLWRREGFPTSEAGLRALPGVGAYTAAAIAAIAFDEPATVVDGNVERVIARLFAVEQPLPAAKPAIRKLAATLTPLGRPGDYAQAMMDLGAIVCTPRTPSCLVCPVRSFCTAAARGDAERFPVKSPKAERPVRRGDAFVIVRKERSDPHILLRRRKDKGLLGGMMEVPCSEWLAHAAVATSPLDGNWKEGQTVQHTFTHFHLEMRVLAAHHDTVGPAAEAFGGDWAALENLSDFALPTVMKKAVASGLAALGLELPSSQPSSRASRRAVNVSTVERSARPSTRAGRK